MNILLDENLSSPDIADRLNAHGKEHGCTFVPFPVSTHRAADDADIPGIAKEVGAAALLSVNVQDFGAKAEYHRALVAAGVSVVVLRVRSGDEGDIEYMISTIVKHVRRIVAILENAESSLVISVDKSNARPRRLRELLERRGM